MLECLVLSLCVISGSTVDGSLNHIADDLVLNIRQSQWADNQNDVISSILFGVYFQGRGRRIQLIRRSRVGRTHAAAVALQQSSSEVRLPYTSPKSPRSPPVSSSLHHPLTLLFHLLPFFLPPDGSAIVIRRRISGRYSHARQCHGVFLVSGTRGSRAASGPIATRCVRLLLGCSYCCRCSSCSFSQLIVRRRFGSTFVCSFVHRAKSVHAVVLFRPTSRFLLQPPARSGFEVSQAKRS